MYYYNTIRKNSIFFSKDLLFFLILFLLTSSHVVHSCSLHQKTLDDGVWITDGGLEGIADGVDEGVTDGVTIGVSVGGGETKEGDGLGGYVGAISSTVHKFNVTFVTFP